MKLEKTKEPIEAKFRLACRIISAIAAAIFSIYFIIDCVFLQKVHVLDGGINWDESWRQAVKWLAVIFIIASSCLVFTDVIWVIVEIFNFKRDIRWNTYGIIIGVCIIVFGLVAIISSSNYIKYDVFFYDQIGNKYLHNDFMAFLSLLFIVCCLCLAVTWKKIDAFSMKLVESDAKSIIRIFSAAPLLIYPFFVWLVLPVDVYTNTNNVIATMLATIMDMCFAAVFVGIFIELVIQFYKNIKLELKSNTPAIALYLISFLIVFCLFVINQSFVDDIIKFQHEWARTISMYTFQQAACIAAVFLSAFDKKIINRKKHEDIYS